MGLEHKRGGVRARLLAAAALAVVAACAALAATEGAHPQSAQAGGGADRPNFIVVVSDDQALRSFNGRTMPFTQRVIANQGTEFKNAIVTTPLCCPARAGFMTGQYTHNHGAWNAYGQFKDPDEHLGSWLQDVGYRTAMVGKYFNHYHKVVNPDTRVAPGWNQWRMFMEPMTYFDYDVSVNGRRVHKGNRERDYATSYGNREATSLVRQWAPDPRPFFLWLSPHAPHSENGNSGGPCSGLAVPAPRDEDLFRNADLPKPPNFNEHRIQDKPDFMRQLSELDRDEVREVEHRYQCRLASLREVDRGVKRVIEALRGANEQDDTVIVFVSDNGIFEGQHRLRDGKRLPYSEAIEIPFAMRIPHGVLGENPPGEVHQPVANIDLAPTLLELAGADACVSASNCRIMDGRSMLPILRRESGWPNDRGLVVEMSNCHYRALRAEKRLVVIHSSTPVRPTLPGCRQANAFEHYDLADDPFQLKNKAQSRRQLPDRLAKRLARLKDCRGIEGRDPDPGQRSYCD